LKGEIEMGSEMICQAGKIGCIGKKIVKFGNMSMFKIGKYSPEIMTVVGVIGVVTATVLACKATLKVSDIVDNHKELMDLIEQAKDTTEDSEYGEKEIMQDKITAYLKTAKSFAELYGPSVVIGALSISLLVGATAILKKRNIALGSAYVLIQEAFKKYRGRVVEELGPEKDFHFRYETDYTTVTEEVTDETGKAKKVKKSVQVLTNESDGSMYARLYAEQAYNTDGTYTGSSQWVPNAEYNATNLVLKNAWANDQLKAKGYLFLNDVYEELGFPRTKAGQVVGWIWQGSGDNYVSFGEAVDNIIRKMPGYLIYRDGSPILLDFNVDGPILNGIE